MLILKECPNPRHSLWLIYLSCAGNTISAALVKAFSQNQRVLRFKLTQWVLHSSEQSGHEVCLLRMWLPPLGKQMPVVWPIPIAFFLFRQRNLFCQDVNYWVICSVRWQCLRKLWAEFLSCFVFFTFKQTAVLFFVSEIQKMKDFSLILCPRRWIIYCILFILKTYWTVSVSLKTEVIFWTGCAKQKCVCEFAEMSKLPSTDITIKFLTGY